jgi:hypothetical protein
MNKPGSSGGRGTSRQWAAPSYSMKNGRAASSLEPDGKSRLGYTNAPEVSAQLETLHARGQNGAPGCDAQSKSGSGDPGRVVRNR